MRHTIALVALVLSFNVFAQETVELNSKNVSINAPSAIVVRTNKTPDTVEIKFMVPMANAVCERYETRHVLRTSAVYCGEDITTRRILIGKVCVRKNPYNDECVNWQDQWRTEQIRRPRTCMVPESYCARYGTSVSMESDKMKVKFKNLPALADSESETFEIKARQKTYDGESVIYDVTPLETLREYKVKQKKILGLFKVDSYEISEK